jgi:hypothetical protein
MGRIGGDDEDARMRGFCDRPRRRAGRLADAALAAVKEELQKVKRKKLEVRRGEKRFFPLLLAFAF